MATVAEKLSNTDLIIDDVKLQPQTYSTILKDEVFNATFQFQLRKKVNKLCKTGAVFKTTIPGTRFGQALIYIEPREYKIIVESMRTGVTVLYFFEFEKVGKFYLKLDKYWELDGTKWIERTKERTIFHGSILKFI